jgi:hypothetical protein
MKTYSWIAVLVVLVFGIGWTSRVVAERAGAGAPALRSEPGRGRPHRGAGGGPFLATVEEFAEELALTEEQRGALQELVDETAGKLAQLEEKVFDVKQQTRSDIREILEPAQLTRLEDLVRSSWDRYREEKLARLARWLDEEGRFDAETRRGVMAVLGDIAAEKSEFFAGMFAAEELPAAGEVEARLEELRERQEERLREYLDEPDLELLLEQERGFGHGVRSRR